MTDALERVPAAYRPSIEAARAIVDRHVSRPYAWPRFLCGVDPAFAGLHQHDLDDAYLDVANPGVATYADIAHCCWPDHLPDRPRSDRRTTIVLPPSHPDSPNAVRNVIHELAHAIDVDSGRIRLLERGTGGFRLPATTPYSRFDAAEEFAEALEILLAPPSADWIARLAAPDFDALRELVGWKPNG